MPTSVFVREETKKTNWSPSQLPQLEPGLRDILHSNNLFLKEQYTKLPRIAVSELPVLILGPSGSGKERIAEAVHRLSIRKDGPFVRLNCSALTEALAESELFGHMKGAFTGAVQDRKGVFETARGGTLFLDEIGDLSAGIQAKLLRALENREIRPVGSDRNIKTNVRIVAATHQDLLSKIKQHHFRADLYYRLNVLQLRTLSLSDRLEDFDDLLSDFSSLFNVYFSEPTVARLRAYPWPGNIREMQNTIARLGAFYPGEVICDQKLASLSDQLCSVQPDACPDFMSYHQFKEKEQEVILQALRIHRGNQRRVAAALGMPKSTLNDKIRNYQIDPRVFKIPSLPARDRLWL